MEPLATRMRPLTLAQFIGQEHLVGKTSKTKSAGPLRVAIEQKHLFSFILWGPPGVGKTTLAQIYAKALGANFYILSAVSAGKDDIRKIVEETGELLGPRVLFLDEIHDSTRPNRTFSHTLSRVVLPNWGNNREPQLRGYSSSSIALSGICT